MSEYRHLIIEFILFFLLAIHMVSPFIVAFSINNSTFALISFILNIISIFTPFANASVMYFIETHNKYTWISTFSLVRNIIASNLAIVCAVLSWLFYHENDPKYYMTNLILTITISIITICGTFYTYSVYHYRKDKSIITFDDSTHFSSYSIN